MRSEASLSEFLQATVLSLAFDCVNVFKALSSTSFG